MKVLVIGGQGFVGRRVVEALGADHEVWTIGRRTGPARHIVVDRESPEVFSKALRGNDFDVVIDLAAYHPRDLASAIELFGDRVVRYVFVSSGVVHRDLDGAAAREEDVILPDGEPPDGPLDYAEGKRWCEAVLARARAEGFPGVSVRPPAVIGAGDRTKRIAAYLTRVDDGGPLLVPQGLVDRGIGVVWNRDVGHVCARLVAGGAPSGAYNVATPDLSMRRFLDTCAEALGRPSPELVEVPEDALASAGLELGAVSPYGPYRRRPGGYDLTRLRLELGFEPSLLSEALQEIVAWYRAERPEHPGYEARERELELARSVEATRNA